MRDVVYVAQTSLYRSEDGGRTFAAYKGAPGGDDNHALWIDPTDSSRMMMASDQGGTISMDGGKSWSSWYNQPTGQIYHLSADSRYPYWVYGTQQDSEFGRRHSAAAITGEITFMDWDPVGGYEFGYIVSRDRAESESGICGRAEPRVGPHRLRTNRQVSTVSPSVTRETEYHMATNPPLGFSPQDRAHVGDMGSQYLLETNDAGGLHWKAISPDLTIRADEKPAPITETAAASSRARPRAQEQQETIAPNNRIAINTFASARRLRPEKFGQGNEQRAHPHDSAMAGRIGRIFLPRGLGATVQISMLEASHFDAATAYAAVDSHEENDFRAHFYRTHDFGKTWQETSAGIPDGSFARVVAGEDPKRRGLLYAGTENAAYVSFDEGDHWSSLRLNMPVTSVRDLVVHGDDLVAATYGRAFWILDDVTPLRQIDPKTSTSTVLFQPEKALRVRLDLNQDTPLPPEMPAGQNPPNGAIFDYYLPAAPSQDITVAIYDSAGKLVRELSTKAGEASSEPPPNVPDYWVGHPDTADAKRGYESLRVGPATYAAPPSVLRSTNIRSLALYQNMRRACRWARWSACREKYSASCLTVNGRTFEQPLLEIAEMDPRVDVFAGCARGSNSRSSRKLLIWSHRAIRVLSQGGRAAADARCGSETSRTETGGRRSDCSAQGVRSEGAASARLGRRRATWREGRDPGACGVEPVDRLARFGGRWTWTLRRLRVMQNRVLKATATISRPRRSNGMTLDRKRSSRM